MTAGPGSTYHLELTGPVPARLAEQIRCRFGPVIITTASGHAVLDGRVADQPAARALLTLVWDAGAEVRLLVLSDHADRR
jgi:hypothetical protein